MDCPSARLLLNFVRTGELDPAEREALDNHLASKTFFEAIDPQQCLILPACIPAAEIVNCKLFITEAE